VVTAHSIVKARNMKKETLTKKYSEGLSLLFSAESQTKLALAA
jgi:hypothetical protein